MHLSLIGLGAGLSQAILVGLSAETSTSLSVLWDYLLFQKLAPARDLM